MLTVKDITHSRVYVSDWKSPIPALASPPLITRKPGPPPMINLLTHDSQSAGSIPISLNICIPASNDMDGQKMIWLQQLDNINSAKSSRKESQSQSSRNDHEFYYKFIFFLLEGNKGSSDTMTSSRFQDQLIVRNATFIDFAFINNQINSEDINEDPQDGTPPFADIWVSLILISNCFLPVVLISSIFVYLESSGKSSTVGLLVRVYVDTISSK